MVNTYIVALLVGLVASKFGPGPCPDRGVVAGEHTKMTGLWYHYSMTEGMSKTDFDCQSWLMMTLEDPNQKVLSVIETFENSTSQAT